MTVDKDRVATYISEIKTSLNTLKNYKNLDKKAFLGSSVAIRDTKYCFIIAAQAAIDLCYHLTAKIVRKAPADYSNCFELLSETGYFKRKHSRGWLLWQSSETFLCIIILRLMMSGYMKSLMS